MALATVPEALSDFKSGKFVIVVDDEERENEGDLVVAAQLVTPEHISFMTRHGSGLVCMPIVAKRLDELGIAPMVEHNTSRLGTAFSVSIDAKESVTTGASAHDRAATIRKVLDPSARSSDFSMPDGGRRGPRDPGRSVSRRRDHGADESRRDDVPDA